MNNGSAVSAELGLRLVIPGETIVPLVASLYYSADDPYAVRIAFHVGRDEPVEWTFARDLLSEGAEKPAGVGDVRIWPSSEPDSDLAAPVVNVQLISSYGEAHFETRQEEVAKFLHRTYEIVPDGSESEHINIEEVVDLLRQSL